MSALKESNCNVRVELLEKLKKENAFWSYDQESISLNALSDDNLIAYVMRYLDLPDINRLFEIFSIKKIKKAWRTILIPEGEYLYTLNRFFAWYIFGIKRPDAYLKAAMTRHANQSIATS